jgi:hypothetical protein
MVCWYTGRLQLVSLHWWWSRQAVLLLLNALSDLLGAVLLYNKRGCSCGWWHAA